MDYLKIVDEILETHSTSTPAQDSPHTEPPADPHLPPVDTPGPDEAPNLDTWRRRYIEREMSTWPPERIKAQEDEIQSILEYRRRRGPVPPGPAAGSIPRSEVFAAIGEVMEKLGKIWPCSLDTDPTWQDKINEAAQNGNREAFLSTVQEWEQSETARVEEYMDKIRKTVSSWIDPYRRQFVEVMQAYTVGGLNPNQAQEKAFNDLKPFIQETKREEKP